MPPRSSDASAANSSENTPLFAKSKVQSHGSDTEQSLVSRVYVEVVDQLDTALPTLQGMVCTKIPWLISLRFVGGIGAHELAAAALATTLCNVTGLSLSVGLSSALSTLSGQAKGELVSRMVHEKRRRVSFDLGTKERATLVADNSEDESNQSNDKEPITPLIFFWRGMVIQLAFILPIAIWWLSGLKDVLISLGQAELLSTMTAKYLKVLAPSLLGYSINWTLTAWLQSIGMADVPAKASVLGLALHVPFNWFFIYFLNLGYLGCGVATVCFNVIQPLFIITYICIYGHGRRRLLESSGGIAIGRTQMTFWKEFSMAMSSGRGYVQYLALALPGIISVSEWWASETAIFLSGQFVPDPEIAVGGMSIYQSINTFCFMFPQGFAISASMRVGNLLGAGKPEGAAFAANVSVLSAACLSLCIGTLLFCIPHAFFPSLFAPGSDGVILETSRTMPLLATYVFADGIQVALNGVIKGCGRQMAAVPIVIVAYWVFGLPLAYYIAFVRHEKKMFCDDSYFCGDVGLVAGMTTGTWYVLLVIFVVFAIKL